jgi:hypothetical protein
MRLRVLVALFAGAAVGLYLPDIDRTFPFLLHRSIITHSVLIPLLCFLAVQSAKARWQAAATMGLCLAVAVHLCFDLFPVVWIGFALISVPFVGQLSGAFSMLVLASSSVACLYLALRLLTTRRALAIVVAVSLACFLIAARAERVFWPALLVLLLSWFVALCLPNPVFQGQVLVQRLRRFVAIP